MSIVNYYSSFFGIVGNNKYLFVILSVRIQDIDCIIHCTMYTRYDETYQITEHCPTNVSVCKTKHIILYNIILLLLILLFIVVTRYGNYINTAKSTK